MGFKFQSLFGFSVSLLLFAVSFCYADEETIQVVGFGECADCKESNIKTVHAFSGLRVTIDCKVGNGEIKTRGVGQLDKVGRFEVSLPKEMMKDGKLKEDCYAQLHSASAAPCPTHNDIEASKIVVTKSENNEKHIVKPAGNLKFYTAFCTSAFLWPHFKYPPFPTLPPFPIYKNPLLPPIPPIYKKPPLPPIPTYQMPPLPPIPTYGKPLLPPIPTYGKPFPSPIPNFPQIPPKYFQHPLFPPSIPHP